MPRFQRIRPFVAPAAILAVGGVALVGLVLTRPEPPAPAGEARTWVVETQTVHPGDRAPTLTLYGRLESPRAPTVTAAIAADVRRVDASDGTRVARGEHLVALDDRDLATELVQRRGALRELRAQIRQARLEHDNDEAALARRERLVALARRRVERAERLAGSDAGSQADVDAARETLAQRRLALIEQRRVVEGFGARMDRLAAQRTQARARVEQAERELERATIEAPFDGRITRVAVAPGDRVRPGDTLVRLFDPSRLEIRATIAAPDVDAVRAALEAGLAPRADVTLGARRVRAVLDRLAGDSPEATGGVEGLFRVVGQPPADVALGRFAELTVELPTRPGLAAVPFSALYGRDRVYVVRDGRMRAVDVARVGQRARPGEPNLALIRAPALRAGDRVVTTQLPRAMDGLAVETRSGGESSSR